MKLNVLQKFTLLSVVVTVVIVVSLSLLVSALLTRWLLAHEVRITAEALRMVTVIDLPAETFERAALEGDAQAFEYIWSHLENVPEVLRVKVYDTDRRIVWSNEGLLIDKIYEDNDELDEALTGRVVAEMGETKAEHEHETPLAPEERLMEVYVPLIDARDGSVYGVFELYKHPDSFFRSKRLMLRMVWTAGLGGGLLLFLSLFGLFRTSLREQMRLQQIERQYAEIEYELSVAGAIQRDLLPAGLPKVPGFNMASFHQPAREIGGDFYDIFPGEDGTFLLVVADGEGKGIPGALLMVEARWALASQAHGVRDVGEIASGVNRLLAPAEGVSKVVTMFLAKLDPAKATLRYCSAGHCPSFLVHDGEATPLGVGGVPLGAALRASYAEETVQLSPGDAVLVYTDGVTEAADPEGRLFGQERLRALLCEGGGGQTAEEIVHRVNAELDRFTGGGALADDVTIFCLVAA